MYIRKVTCNQLVVPRWTGKMTPRRRAPACYSTMYCSMRGRRRMALPSTLSSPVLRPRSFPPSHRRPPVTASSGLARQLGKEPWTPTW